MLVDRLWPRGLKRTDSRVGRWMPEVAPSTELRRWYDQDAARAAEFRERYLIELGELDAALSFGALVELAEAGPVLLTTATRRVELSHAALLQQLLTDG